MPTVLPRNRSYTHLTTCSKHIRGKFLQIQGTDTAEATAVSVLVYRPCPDIENEDLSEKIHKNIRVFMLSCIKHARFHAFMYKTCTFSCFHV